MGLFFDGCFECRDTARNLTYFFYCVKTEAEFVSSLNQVSCEYTRASAEQIFLSRKAMLKGMNFFSVRCVAG